MIFLVSPWVSVRDCHGQDECPPRQRRPRRLAYLVPAGARASSSADALHDVCAPPLETTTEHARPLAGRPIALHWPVRSPFLFALVVKLKALLTLP